MHITVMGFNMGFNEVICVAAVVTLLTQGSESQIICGQRSPRQRIVGGQDADLRDWPWQVSLQNFGRHFCGGSIVNDDSIVTAAHCFSSTSTRGLIVSAGRQRLQGSDSNEETRTVSRVIRHPGYNRITFDNDIAILKLSSPLPVTDFIRPICLAASDSTFFAGVDSWVTGWGNIAESVSLPSPQNLMEVKVPIVGPRQCKCDYGINTITENMLCAGLRDGGKDACQGDSGGPLMVLDDDKWALAGIVSFGFGCARPNFPGVYTRLPRYQTWINEHIKSDQLGYVTFTSTGTNSDLSVSCIGLPPITTTTTTTTTTTRTTTTSIIPTTTSTTTTNTLTTPSTTIIHVSTTTPSNTTTGTPTTVHQANITVIPINGTHTATTSLTTSQLTTTTAPSTTPTPVVCGQAPRNSRIAEGTSAASEGMWPWMASLQKNGAHVCGGTLVAVDFVLSSANCFSSSPVASDWTVVLGRLTQNGSNPFEQTLDVTNITLSNTTGTNIALLQLSAQPTLSDYTQPICLDDGRTFADGTVCWAAGWSNGRGGDEQVLQQLQTSVVNCGNASATDNICTESFTLEQGDSGGPLMCIQDQSWFQAVVLTAPDLSRRRKRENIMVFSRVNTFNEFLTETLGTRLSPPSTSNNASGTTIATTANTTTVNIASTTNTTSTTMTTAGAPAHSPLFFSICLLSLTLCLQLFLFTPNLNVLKSDSTYQLVAMCTMWLYFLKGLLLAQTKGVKRKVRNAETMVVMKMSSRSGLTHFIHYTVMGLNKVICVAAVLTLLTQGSESQLNDCGKPPLNSRIVGGEVASPGSWPWQVSLHDSEGHFCGGSLINSKWVLSAAHCFPNIVDVTVYLGRQSQEGSNPNEVSRGVTRIIIHPDYNNGTAFNNDIALLELSSPVNFTNYILPICVAASNSTVFTGVNTTVTGWGNIAEGVSLPFPRNLMEVDVPIVGLRQCKCDHGIDNVTENMLCAGLSEGGKDSCQEDSGGPLVSKQDSQWTQLGIVSWGIGCALPNLPGVYTRVSQYESWINSHITSDPPGYVTFTSTGTDSDLSVSCDGLPPITTTIPSTTTPSTTTTPVSTTTSKTTAAVCGQALRNSRIAGGASVVSEGVWPWMASLQKNGTHVCGGTLVAVDFVLSSADCFSSSPVASDWTVVLGRLKQNGSNPNEQTLNVKNITLSNITETNIALLQLSAQPTLSDYIQPICLDNGQTVAEGTMCWAAGWSNGRGGDEQVLQEFQTSVVNCGNASATGNICTTSFTLEQGDSGGPLMYKQDNSWFQVTVLTVQSLSRRRKREDVMVFRRVNTYEPFLEDTLGTFLSPASTSNSTNPTTTANTTAITTNTAAITTNTTATTANTTAITTNTTAITTNTTATTADMTMTTAGAPAHSPLFLSICLLSLTLCLKLFQ
ncbi:transmembrane protease serine 9-like [Pholidichthys leucotaenia]